jgi:hypothetical protein
MFETLPWGYLWQESALVHPLCLLQAGVQNQKREGGGYKNQISFWANGLPILLQILGLNFCLTGLGLVLE